MISGRFGIDGQLFFEIELIAANGDSFEVEVLLDTGFTAGFLAINSQDLEVLQWPLMNSRVEITTVKGNDYFDIYEGKTIVDGQELTVPVHVGENIPEILIGSPWLEIMDLVVRKGQGILTLEIV